MAAKKKKQADAVESPEFWKPNIDDIIVKTGKSVGMTPVSMQRSGYVNHSVSTGLLVSDLAVGGGFSPGRFCGTYGKEAGGKSTVCAASVAQAQKKGIQSYFFDHEGSADPGYWGRIGVELYGNFRGAEEQEQAGTANGFKAGPHLMYYAPSTAEKSLKFMARLLHQSPDKKQYNDKWYYNYTDMTQKDAKEKGIPYDVKITRELGGGVWIPAEDGRAQGIFFIDSLASMKPSALVGTKDKKGDDWKDESGAQALLARVFAEYLPGLLSLMVEKRFTIVATNQLREAPGVQFGNPEYAPGGKAQEHAHDTRVKITKRAVPAGWKGKSGVGEEPCWDGNGTDHYTFSKFLVEKCKDFMPMSSGWVRWWFKANGRPGPGIDPVFDTWQYLRMTGQLDLSGKKWEMSLPGHEAVLDYPAFKALILDPENKEAVRNACWDQLRNGDGFERYFDTPDLDEKQEKVGEGRRR